MNIYEEALKFHEEKKGKYEIKPTCEVKTAKDLSLAYTPGVAEPCREIHKDPSKAYIYTRKWNTVAVISDGTAVLGLGDIVHLLLYLSWRVRVFYLRNLVM